MSKRVKAALRVSGVLGIIMGIASGVTFAALQSQNVVLTGSRLTSATANLLIGGNDGQYGTSTTGFSFENVEPGGVAMPVAGNMLKLRNSGSSDLHLRLSLNSTTLRNPNNIKIAKVFLLVSAVNGGTPAQVSLGSLYTAHASNTTVPIDITVPAGQDMMYELRMQMTSDAVSSTTSAAVMDGIDLIFSGVSQ